MASVKFKKLEVGHSYNALIWHTNSSKEPVEVKVTAIDHTDKGIAITTDKFLVIEDRGSVMHAETRKRVTFRTLDDKPDYTPIVPTQREPRAKTEQGFKPGSANAFGARLPNAPVLNMETTLPEEEAEGNDSDKPEMSKRARFRKEEPGFCVPLDRLTQSGTEHILKGPDGESVWVWELNNWRLPKQKGIREPRRMAANGYRYVGPAPEKADDAA